MFKPRVTAILAAETNGQDARHLLRSLTPLGRPVRLATTTQDVLELLRREIFIAAVAAVEMALDGEPMLARLARLPSLEHLVAVGPVGEMNWRNLAYRAGAETCLTRPVTTEALAGALGLEIPSVTERPP